VKTVFSRSAAAVLPPAAVHRLLRQAAARAVRRVKTGKLRPLVMERPYRVRFCLRRSFTEDDWVRETVGRLEGVSAGEGRGCFAYASDSAEAVGNLLNEIEWTVLKP
jgi:D-aminopeptidase